MFNISLMRPK